MYITCDEILLVCKKINEFKKRQNRMKKIKGFFGIPFDVSKLRNAELDEELVDFYWLSFPRTEYANLVLRTIYNRYVK